MTRKVLTTVDLVMLGAVAQLKRRVYKEEAAIDCHCKRYISIYTAALAHTRHVPNIQS